MMLQNIVYDRKYPYYKAKCTTKNWTSPLKSLQKHAFEYEGLQIDLNVQIITHTGVINTSDLFAWWKSAGAPGKDVFKNKRIIWQLMNWKICVKNSAVLSNVLLSAMLREGEGKTQRGGKLFYFSYFWLLLFTLANSDKTLEFFSCSVKRNMLCRMMS